MRFRSADLKRLIDAHGTQVTFTSVSEGAYDPTTGSATNTPTEKTVKAYFYDYLLSEVDGTHIVLGDRRVAMSLLDTSGVAIPEPEAGDTLEGQGDKVSIISVSKIMSVSPMCYLLQVRE